MPVLTIDIKVTQTELNEALAKVDRLFTGSGGGGGGGAPRVAAPVSAPATIPGLPTPAAVRTQLNELQQAVKSGADFSEGQLRQLVELGGGGGSTVSVDGGLKIVRKQIAEVEKANRDAERVAASVSRSVAASSSSVEAAAEARTKKRQFQSEVLAISPPVPLVTPEEETSRRLKEKQQTELQIYVEGSKQSTRVREDAAAASSVRSAAFAKAEIEQQNQIAKETDASVSESAKQRKQTSLLFIQQKEAETIATKKAADEAAKQEQQFIASQEPDRAKDFGKSTDEQAKKEQQIADAAEARNKQIADDKARTVTLAVAQNEQKAKREQKAIEETAKLEARTVVEKQRTVEQENKVQSSAIAENLAREQRAADQAIRITESRTRTLEDLKNRAESLDPNSIARASAPPMSDEDAHRLISGGTTDAQFRKETQKYANNIKRAEGLQRNAILGQRFALLFGVSGGIGQIAQAGGDKLPGFGPISSLIGIAAQTIPLTAGIGSIAATGGVLVALEIIAKGVKRQQQAIITGAAQRQFVTTQLESLGGQTLGAETGQVQRKLDRTTGLKGILEEGVDPKDTLAAANALLKAGVTDASIFGSTLENALKRAKDTGQDVNKVIGELNDKFREFLPSQRQFLISSELAGRTAASRDLVQPSALAAFLFFGPRVRSIRAESGGPEDIQKQSEEFDREAALRGPLFSGKTSFKQTAALANFNLLAATVQLFFRKERDAFGKALQLERDEEITRTSKSSFANAERLRFDAANEGLRPARELIQTGEVARIQGQAQTPTEVTKTQIQATIEAAQGERAILQAQARNSFLSIEDSFKLRADAREKGTEAEVTGIKASGKVLETTRSAAAAELEAFEKKATDRALVFAADKSKTLQTTINTIQDRLQFEFLPAEQQDKLRGTIAALQSQQQTLATPGGARKEARDGSDETFTKFADLAAKAGAELGGITKELILQQAAEAGLIKNAEDRAAKEKQIDSILKSQAEKVALLRREMAEATALTSVDDLDFSKSKALLEQRLKGLEDEKEIETQKKLNAVDTVFIGQSKLSQSKQQFDFESNLSRQQLQTQLQAEQQLANIRLGLFGVSYQRQLEGEKEVADARIKGLVEQRDQAAADYEKAAEVAAALDANTPTGRAAEQAAKAALLRVDELDNKVIIEQASRDAIGDKGTVEGFRRGALGKANLSDEEALAIELAQTSPATARQRNKQREKLLKKGRERMANLDVDGNPIDEYRAIGDPGRGENFRAIGSRPADSEDYQGISRFGRKSTKDYRALGSPPPLGGKSFSEVVNENRGKGFDLFGGGLAGRGGDGGAGLLVAGANLTASANELKSAAALMKAAFGGGAQPPPPANGGSPPRLPGSGTLFVR